MTSQTQQSYDRGTIPAWTLGDKIRKARDVAGMNQKEFAAAIDIKASSLAAYETDRATPPFKKVQSMAKAINLLTGIPQTWFLFEDDEPTAPPAKLKLPDLDSNQEPIDSPPAPENVVPFHPRKTRIPVDHPSMGTVTPIKATR